MKNIKIKNLAILIAATGLLTALVPSANASINCDSWSKGGTSGDTVFGCDFTTKQTSGDCFSSYTCLTSFNKGFCDIDYNQNCKSYQGDCSIVFNCKDGKSYCCDLKNWDGCTQIVCKDLPKDCWNDCKDIEIRCPKTAVPEPSTVVAGALLLIPFGLSTLRILRKNKVQPVIK